MTLLPAHSILNQRKKSTYLESNSQSGAAPVLNPTSGGVGQWSDPPTYTLHLDSLRAAVFGGLLAPSCVLQDPELVPASTPKC